MQTTLIVTLEMKLIEDVIGILKIFKRNCSETDVRNVKIAYAV